MPPTQRPQPASPKTTKVTARPVPEDHVDYVRTKILLLGLRRSGKTSIRQVLVDDLPAKQSFFIESTMKITRVQYDTIIPIEIWDCPGDITPESLKEPLSSFASIIFVIDILAKLPQPIERLIQFFVLAFQENPYVNLEVFVHKAEALAEDFRDETYRIIHARIMDELADLSPLTISVAQSPSSPSFSSPMATPSSSASPSQTREIDADQIQPNFNLTSVHDNSLRFAFAQVLHRLLSQTSLPYLEDLLNVFCSTAHASKAFLFDTRARVYVATDNSPVDTTTHNLCCDYVDTLNSFSGLYQSSKLSPTRHPRRTGARLITSPSPSVGPSTPSTPKSRASTPSHTSSAPPAASSSTSSPSTLLAHSRLPSASAPDAVQGEPTGSTVTAVSDSPSTSIQSLTHALSQSHIQGSQLHASSKTQASSSAQNPPKPVFHASASTSLTPYTTLIYHAVTPPAPPPHPSISSLSSSEHESAATLKPASKASLALVALLPTSVWESKRGLVEYNVVFFREGVQEIYEVELDARRRKVVLPVFPRQQPVHRQ